MKINKKIFLSLYYHMLRVRMVEEKIAELYPEQEMRCPVHLCIGQEAIAVGVCANLLKKDYLLSNHRSHGHYLAKGGDLRAMLAELYSKADGCSGGKGGSMHLIDLSAGFLGATPIVGSTIPIAVGVSFGFMLRKEKRVAIVFFGDAAVEEGVFHESINFAVLKKLPVIFVCENNLYSVFSPLSVRQPPEREIFNLAKGQGMESYSGDGNDVVAVYNLTETAVAKARQGDGPTFLEFKTYRWREHCGPNYDYNLGYRTKEELEEWQKRCPVERIKKHLLEAKLLFPQDITEMANRISAEIEEAVAFAKNSPFPKSSAFLNHIYAP